MRTLRIFLLFLIALTCFGALPAQAKPPARVVNKTLHFSLELPTEWKPKPNAPSGIWMYAAPAGKGVPLSVAVVTAATGVSTLPDEAGFFKGLRHGMGAQAGVYDTKKTTVAGLPAYSSRAHLHIAGRADIENRQIACVYNGSVYSFIFTSAAAQKKQADLVYDKIIASIRFEK